MSEPRATVEVEMDPTEQGFVVFDGTGPIVLIDSMTADDVAELFVAPVARRVLAARLHAWADLVDKLVASGS